MTFRIFLRLLSWAILGIPSLLTAQIKVGGTLNGEVTWSPQYGPYEVRSDLVIAADAYLSIEPGTDVVVRRGVSIEVYGKLLIVGLEVDSVRFGSVREGFSWVGFRLHEGAEMAAEFTRFSDASVAIDALRPDVKSLGFSFCSFLHNVHGIRGDLVNTMVVDACSFRHNEIAIQGRNQLLRNSEFLFNNVGADAEYAYIEDCLFRGHSSLALDLKSGVVLNNGFYENDVALKIDLQIGSLVRGNIFEANNLAVFISDASLELFQFDGNVICAGASEALRYEGTESINLSSNCWCLTDSAAIESIILDREEQALSGKVEFVPFDTTCAQDYVYPGDANYDQTVDVSDLLPIGLKYGSTGPVRPNATIGWTPQAAHDWGDTLKNSADIKHVDCNGDGTIDSLDAQAILVNYQLVPMGFKNLPLPNPNGSVLSLNLPSGSINAGDTLHIPIDLGTIDTPAVNLYGLSFSLSYDTSLLEPGAIWASFDSSWLGVQDSNLLTVTYDAFVDGLFDVGLTRTDLVSITGYGRMVDITVVLDDDLAKRMIPAEMNFLQVTATTESGEEISLNWLSRESREQEPYIAPGEPDLPSWNTQEELAVDVEEGIRIFPNPTNSTLTVRFNEVAVERLELIDVKGRLILRREVAAKDAVILRLDAHQPGIYFLRAISDSQTRVFKVSIVP